MNDTTKKNLDSLAQEKKSFEYLPYEPQMEPTDPDSLNLKRTAVISLAFLTVLMAWSFFNFKVPLLLDAVIGNNPFKDLIKGSIMAMDNFIAILLQPLFGDLSDRTKSRFGRRMPYIIIGTLSSAVFFVIIPWIRVLAGLILIIFLFDLAMSIYRSASIAILPDYTSDRKYSQASALQQFIANMGGLIGFLLPLIISMIPNLSAEWFDALGFLIIAILMVLLLIVQNVIIKETPSGEKAFEISENRLELETSSFKVREIKGTRGEVKNPMLRAYKDAGKIIKKDRDFKFFLIAVILMYLAFASVEAFFSSFAVQYIGTTEGEASILFIAYSGPMILSAYFVGLLGQKIGRKKAVKIFLTWMIISIFIMAVFIVPIIYQNHQPILVITMLALISIPWMGFITNSFSILWALAPEGETGTYTGIYYTFNQSAYSLAPILFGGILTIFSAAFGDFRYIVMFPFILICVIVALLMFIKIKGGDVAAKRELIKKRIEKLVESCKVKTEEARKTEELGKCEEGIEILEKQIIEIENARKEILDFAPVLTEELTEQIEIMENQLKKLREIEK
ncbi:MAG: membrane protein of unknown function [Promethearchaeota archaeon]|nr:MAG: membrane protein of unknown function [Candidatus Lokiarchaeota archaeon]